MLLPVGWSLTSKNEVALLKFVLSEVIPLISGITQWVDGQLLYVMFTANKSLNPTVLNSLPGIILKLIPS